MVENYGIIVEKSNLSKVLHCVHVFIQYMIQ